MGNEGDDKESKVGERVWGEAKVQWLRSLKNGEWRHWRVRERSLWLPKATVGWGWKWMRKGS